MMLRKKIVAALLTGGLAGVSGQAAAHWSSGPFLYNDAGANPMHLAPNELPSTVLSHTASDPTLVPGTSTATGTGYGTYTQTRTTTSDYGWIQAQDNSLWGNSHDNKGLAFSLAGSSTVTFTISTLGDATSVIQTGASTATTLSGDWTPAFSIFQGLAPQSAHEGGAGNSTLSNNLPGYVAWGPYASVHPYSAATDTTYKATTGNTYTGDGTWGAYRSNADWVSGRDVSASATYKNGDLIGTSLEMDAGNVSKLIYLGSAAAAAGAHTVTATFNLGPGDYSIWVGGTNAQHAAEQQANYQTLLAAHQANDAEVAIQLANYDALLASDPTLAAAQDNYDTVFASHTATAQDKADAKAALDAALAANPEASSAYSAWQTALQPITDANSAIAALRSPYGFNITTTVTSVPVPGALWLFGSALAGLVGFGRRKSAVMA